jgi:hypothetical protein
MSGLIACCGLRWAVGTWSDALFGLQGIRPSFDGRCGECNRELCQPVEIRLCGEGLCMDRATHACSVIGGPVLYFCTKHAETFVAACTEAGVKGKLRGWAPEEPKVNGAAAVTVKP